MNGSRVTVVIPSWNGERWLRRCLEALRQQRFQDFEVLVVDNGSTDGSRALVEECCPDARWIGLKENRGFAAAVNIGIRAARGELVALLNNDTEADPGWLEALVGALDRRPEIAFAATRMRDDRDRSRIDGAGDAMNWYGIPSKIGQGQPDGPPFAEEREVFGACAGAAIYRRTFFETVGLFEESFFAYIEDVDLSFRAQLAGLRCLYVPSAIVYHVGSATSGRNSDLALGLSTRNQLLMVVRNFPWPSIWTRLPKVFYAQCWLTHGAWKESRLGVVLRAYAAFVAHLPRALVARRRIQAGRRVTVRQLELVLDRCEHLESRRLRRIATALSPRPRTRKPAGQEEGWTFPSSS